jgi:hypothetical protein
VLAGPMPASKHPSRRKEKSRPGDEDDRNDRTAALTPDCGFSGKQACPRVTGAHERLRAHLYRPGLSQPTEGAANRDRCNSI